MINSLNNSTAGGTKGNVGFTDNKAPQTKLDDEELGNPKFKEKVEPVRTLRERLAKKINQDAKSNDNKSNKTLSRKSSPGKRDRKSLLMSSNFNKSMMELDEKDKLQDTIGKAIDFAMTVKAKPRDFNYKMPILSLLGINNYDKFENGDLSQLKVEVEEALDTFIKNWKSKDSKYIMLLMRKAVLREVVMIEARKNARRIA